jgi:hypothetical protein
LNRFEPVEPVKMVSRPVELISSMCWLNITTVLQKKKSPP